MTLERQGERSRSPLDTCPEPVVSLDEQGCVVALNAACAGLLGLEPARALGRALPELVTLTPRDETGRFPERHWATAGTRRVPVELTQWTSADGRRTLTHLLLRDSTHRLAAETENDRAAEALRRQARYDALTGLANRYELEERLADALAAAGTARVALLVADLDGFKPVNDRFGHHVGDEVLAALARRLRRCVRDGDTVARVGGDEFVVLTAVESPTEPSSLAARVRQALQEPVRTSAGVLQVGASVGVAVADQDSDGADLLRQADKAMYRVKLAGT